MISSKLSGREKSMIYFLLCLVIVAVGTYFIIVPGYKKANDLQIDLEAKQQVYNTMVYTQNSLEETNKKLAERAVEILELQTQFFDPLHTEIVDRIIIGFMRSHNLTPESATFVATTLTPVDPIRPVEGLILPEGEVMGVTYTVKGSIEDLKLMLNDIRADGRFLVSDFEYVREEDGETQTGEFKFGLKMIRLVDTSSTEGDTATEENTDVVVDDVADDGADDLELE